jgi:hypothetical protein
MLEGSIWKVDGRVYIRSQANRRRIEDFGGKCRKCRERFECVKKEKAEEVRKWVEPWKA